MNSKLIYFLTFITYTIFLDPSISIGQTGNRIRAIPFDCKEDHYYFFHGGDFEQAASPNEVINNTPWRMTGRVLKNNLPAGTGIYIGNGLVITHAHGLETGNGMPPSISFALAQYGKNNVCIPYGKIPVKQVYIPKEWVENINSQSVSIRAYDFAILELAYLPKPSGNFPSPKSWTLSNWAVNGFLHQEAHVLGYGDCAYAPGDTYITPIKTNSEKGRIFKLIDHKNGGGTLIMRVDGCVGMSGGPVFVESMGRPILVGVMVGSPKRVCENGEVWAAALTPGVRTRIDRIKKSISSDYSSHQRVLYWQQVRRDMKIYNLNPTYYLSEEPTCNSYFR